MLIKNLKRKNLVNKIYHDLGFSKNISSIIIDDFFECLISELIKANKIKISSFGTFEIIKKKERMGRNPKTKVSTKISARKVVKFKSSRKLKERLKNNGG